MSVRACKAEATSIIAALTPSTSVVLFFRPLPLAEDGPGRLSPERSPPRYNLGKPLHPHPTRKVNHQDIKTDPLCPPHQYQAASVKNCNLAHQLHLPCRRRSCTNRDQVTQHV